MMAFGNEVVGALAASMLVVGPIGDKNAESCTRTTEQLSHVSEMYRDTCLDQTFQITLPDGSIVYLYRDKPGASKENCENLRRRVVSLRDEGALRCARTEAAPIQLSTH